MARFPWDRRIPSFVSAGTIRENVLGENDVQPDAEQLQHMRQHQAMEEGALGVTTAPSDYMLARFGTPYFHLIFELMIYAALLESGTGAVLAAGADRPAAGAAVVYALRC